MKDFSALLKPGRFALTEGSVYERLHRDPDIPLSPEIRHGGLVYTAPEKLIRLHAAYCRVAEEKHLPMLILTDTWRANAERLAASEFAGKPVNQDSAALLCDLASRYADIYTGGLMGCRGDAYRPEEALSEADAVAFHTPQAEALGETDLDFLMASTLPAVSEAAGLARAMAATGKPRLISFVIRRDGTVLDGTPLGDAIKTIDDIAAPTGFAVNCVHPTVLMAALKVMERTAPDQIRRIVCFQANTSAMDPDDLNNCAELQTEAPEDLAREMVAVRRYGLPLLGGCCGTDERHIAAIADACAKIIPQV